jgi:hypothetical protein
LVVSIIFTNALGGAMHPACWSVCVGFSETLKLPFSLIADDPEMMY